MAQYKLFTPIDGVIIKTEKQKNAVGIELPENSEKKNEGIIVSNNISFSAPFLSMLNVKDNAILNKILHNTKVRFTEGTKVKFLEGYPLEDNLIYVPLDKIIGIY